MFEIIRFKRPLSQLRKVALVKTLIHEGVEVVDATNSDSRILVAAGYGEMALRIIVIDMEIEASLDKAEDEV